jgi:hypothetical protein
VFGRRAICRASGKRQQWRRADSSIALETCHNPGHDTKHPRLLREMGRTAGNTWGVARSARHLLRARHELCTTQCPTRQAANAMAKRVPRTVHGHAGRQSLAVACGCVGALIRNQVVVELLTAPRHKQMQPTVETDLRSANLLLDDATSLVVGSGCEHRMCHMLHRVSSGARDATLSDSHDQLTRASVDKRVATGRHAFNNV